MSSLVGPSVLCQCQSAALSSTSESHYSLPSREVLSLGHLRTGTASKSGSSCKRHPTNMLYSNVDCAQHLGSEGEHDVAPPAVMITKKVKCYHSMLWMSSNFGDLPLVSEAFDARYSGKGKPWTTEDFDQIFHDFGAVSEMPAITMVPEMLAAYPNAKIILVERDIESWYESFDKAIVSPNDSAIIRCDSRLRNARCRLDSS